MKNLQDAVRVIDRWVAYQRYFRRIPGVAVGVVHGDRTVFAKGYGYADLVNKIPVTATTNFRIASISKTFTATAIMQLAAKKKILLDDPVRKYLSWFGSAQTKRDLITIRQLLTHTSGLVRDGTTSHWVDDGFPKATELKKQASHIQQSFPALTRFKYSNLGFALLGAVIERVSGVSYQEYMQKNIVTPLRLSNTMIDYSLSRASRLARGYSRDIPEQERTAFTHCKTNSYASATGFISNLEDLCSYVRAHFLGNGLLLPDAQKREMHRVQWMRPNGEWHSGLGFHIWKIGKRYRVGHGGGFAGYSTRLALDEEDQIGVVVLSNAIDGQAYVFLNGIFHIMDYFRNKQKQSKQRRNVHSEEKFEGLYSSRWRYMQFVTTSDGLVGFAPSEDPTADFFYTLLRVEDDMYTITQCSEIDYVGENIHFCLNAHGDVTGLSMGPTPMQKDTILDR